MKNLATGLRIAALAATVFACGEVLAAASGNPFAESKTKPTESQPERQERLEVNEADVTSWSLVLVGKTQDRHTGVHYTNYEQSVTFATERVAGTKADCIFRAKQLSTQFKSLAWRHKTDSVDFLYSCEPDVLSLPKATKKSAP